MLDELGWLSIMKSTGEKLWEFFYLFSLLKMPFRGPGKNHVRPRGPKVGPMDPMGRF